MADKEAPPKRKRNRKKKSKGGDNSNKNDSVKDEEKRETSDQKLNPHAVLREKLISKGFTGAEVDKAMEEMWDKGHAYDEYDAVLKYLKSVGKAEEEEADSKKEETKAQDGEKDGGVEESKEVEAEAVAKEEAKPAPPMTMAAKLDMVAGFENMTDAIFALTEWVSKAAKPREVSGGN
jgi:hypothetical protein